MKELSATCCIAGGGPAGMMLGLLLARKGIDVIVLEKHNDFFRDFRGDTIHPSTFSVMEELGMLEEFLTIPHDEETEIQAVIEGEKYSIADFSGLPVTHRAVGFMPQWDFLKFLLKKANVYSAFHMMMNTEAVNLIGTENISGVLAKKFGRRNNTNQCGSDCSCRRKGLETRAHGQSRKH